MTTPPSPGEAGDRIPRAWVRALAIGMILTPIEWRVTMMILGMPRPVSSRWIAKRLSVEYSHVKRAVRSLEAWSIVHRSPDGLVFQPDFRLWRQPSAEEGAQTGPPGSSA